jgi:probable rRNA maturation factor
MASFWWFCFLRYNAGLMRGPNIELQIALSVARYKFPTLTKWRRWILAALAEPKRRNLKKPETITIRLTGRVESAALNLKYRQKLGPTNILTFIYNFPPPAKISFGGDMVICLPLVEAEAAAQHKTFLAHAAHLTVHGVLHILGYEHERLRPAREMENLEAKILAKLGFKNPYF